MKFTLSWLKDHLDTTASIDEITYALTDLGLEVEGVENPAAKLADFTLGYVQSAEKHPDADRLNDHLRRAECAGGDHRRRGQAGRLCAGDRHDHRRRQNPRC